MKKFLLASAGLIALSGSLLADTVSTTGTFSAFPTGFSTGTPTWISNGTSPGAPTGGTPFWNDASDDTGNGGSHLMNIGYALTGTGGFTSSILGSESLTGAQDLTNGGSDVPFNMVRNATAYNITLLYADSLDNTGANASTGVVGTTFGYVVGTTATALYNVGNVTSPTGTQSFNPSGVGGVYGFYATVCYNTGNCETYYTNGNAVGTSGGGSAWNHFALFELADGNYVIGFTGQNMVAGEYHGDYQDVVIELSQVSIPEPGTVAIMGLGLAAIGVLGRRRYAKK
jgi:hypothetical protein